MLQCVHNFTYPFTNLQQSLNTLIFILPSVSECSLNAVDMTVSLFPIYTDKNTMCLYVGLVEAPTMRGSITAAMVRSLEEDPSLSRHVTRPPRPCCQYPRNVLC